VDEDQVRPGALTVDRPLPVVRGAVVSDHEHPLCLAVGLDAHELLDQRIERLDPILGRAAVKQLRAARPSGEVAERPLRSYSCSPNCPSPPGRGWLGVLARASLDL